MADAENINWLFGRGLSIACGLSWSVPLEWQNMPREKKITQIRKTLRQEMDSVAKTHLIKCFLNLLADKTTPNWRNRFITTNWDYLLQKEILALDFDVLPAWLDNSHVFHLNGTIEELDDDSNRSPFLLEEDSANERYISPEANDAYNKMILGGVFVVAGMSFECDTDKFLLNALGRVEDDLPIGDSIWIIVNRNKSALELSCSRIREYLPHATLKCVHSDLNDWIESGLPELQEYGAIAS